eukprot:1871873-Pyramimonas_sp.AAC.1
MSSVGARCQGGSLAPQERTRRRHRRRRCRRRCSPTSLPASLTAACATAPPSLLPRDSSAGWVSERDEYVG